MHFFCKRREHGVNVSSRQIPLLLGCTGQTINQFWSGSGILLIRGIETLTFWIDVGFQPFFKFMRCMMLSGHVDP